MVMIQEYKTFSQLTAPGVTDSMQVNGKLNYTIQYIIASIDTNVVVRAEGSLDGTNFFNLDESGDTTQTADGVYGFKKSETPLEYIRFRFVSESGGTGATIDVSILASQ